MLDRGADPNLADASGRTPMHMAARCDQLDRDLASALLAAGAAIDPLDDDSDTPLVVAASYTECVLGLRRRNASLVG